MSGVLDAAAWLVSVLAASTVAALLTGRWLRSRLAGQSQPVEPSSEDLDRLWLEVQDRAAVVEAPRVPRQFHRVGEPLTSADLDRIIASFEPCGSTSPTCRLHVPGSCWAEAPCCPSCPGPLPFPSA